MSEVRCPKCNTISELVYRDMEVTFAEFPAVTVDVEELFCPKCDQKYQSKEQYFTYMITAYLQIISKYPHLWESLFKSLQQILMQEQINMNEAHDPVWEPIVEEQSNESEK